MWYFVMSTSGHYGGKSSRSEDFYASMIMLHIATMKDGFSSLRWRRAVGGEEGGGRWYEAGIDS